jgi:hypothetical protein
VRFFVVLAAGALLLPTCGSTATQSGLWGTVRRGPIMPVCMENRPCDEPAGNLTLVFVRNSRVAARVTTKQDGSYRITLRPGIYGVRTPQKISIGRGVEPAKVRVPANRRAHVNFFIDTGIR